MSKYTTEVRFICETYAGLRDSTGQADVNDIIQSAIPSIFNFNYPIFDEAYRNVLETKILKHYYLREIAHETVGLWKLRLDVKLNEIMPYYNQLYKSELLEFNPLYDTEITKEREGINTGNETVNGTTGNVGSINSDSETRISGGQNVTTTDTQTVETTNNKTGSSINNGTVIEDTERTTDIKKSHEDAYNETPQGSVKDLKDMKYLTNARIITDHDKNTDVSKLVSDTSNDIKTEEHNNVNTTAGGTKNTDIDETRTTTDESSTRTNNTTTVNNNRDMTSTEEYLESVKGKQSGKSYSELLKEYRSTFLNIDMMVIDELSDLFFNLW